MAFNYQQLRYGSAQRGALSELDQIVSLAYKLSEIYENSKVEKTFAQFVTQDVLQMSQDEIFPIAEKIREFYTVERLSDARTYLIGYLRSGCLDKEKVKEYVLNAESDHQQTQPEKG